MEIHWKEEHEMFVQKSLEDARSGKNGHANEIKELRQSLDEAIEKSTVLQADLLQAEHCRDDFVSQSEQLSVTAERESQQQKEREKRLLEDMAEKEIHWKEEHEMFVQKSEEDARSGDDVYATEIKELRQSLDEAIEKSTVLQADLL